MENGIETCAMNTVIFEKLQEVRDMPASAQEYKIAVDAVVALQKANTEAIKLKHELEQSEQELKERKKDRWVTIAIGAAEIIVPAAVYWALYNKGLKFEMTGTVTSGFFRNLIGKIRPTK